MAESANERLFRTKVLPIMDKVMADLQRKQADETRRHTSSLPYIFAGAAGPDGGMSAQAASIASLRYTGEWNSKHTEDYINMVKAELKRQKITVTPEIEKMMIADQGLRGSHHRKAGPGSCDHPAGAGGDLPDPAAEDRGHQPE